MLIRLDPRLIENLLICYCVFVWGNLISRSKKQGVVSRSSAESEPLIGNKKEKFEP